MNQDIREAQIYQNLLAAYRNNIRESLEQPSLEQATLVITKMLSKHEIPEDLEIFFISMAGAWLAQLAKEQRITNETAPSN